MSRQNILFVYPTFVLTFRGTGRLTAVARPGFKRVTTTYSVSRCRIVFSHFSLLEKRKNNAQNEIIEHLSAYAE